MSHSKYYQNQFAKVWYKNDDIMSHSKYYQKQTNSSPSLTSEWNAAMALSISTVLVRALAIASLFFRLLCNFTCNVSEALMLAMRVLFCSSLSKVCSCVSELLMLAIRILLFYCLLNVSSRDSKALLRFARLLYSSIAGFSFQIEGMTTLTNRSPRVYHCTADIPFSSAYLYLGPCSTFYHQQ